MYDARLRVHGVAITPVIYYILYGKYSLKRLVNLVHKINFHISVRVVYCYLAVSTVICYMVLSLPVVITMAQPSSWKI